MWGLRNSDQRLVAAVRAGDERAFEQLHERYEGLVFGFCRHLTGQREDAEDAVQHTFLAAYRQMTESDRRIEVRPWLFTVARNRCLTLLARRRAVQPQADPAGPPVADLAEEVQRREDLRQLVHDLGGLPEPQRAALLLSEFESLSHREVAQVLDVPAMRVKALVFQARSSLAATREAREAPCRDIRQQLTTLSGSALRRRLLRRHVRECSGCSEFAAAISRQRRGLAALLPAVGVRGGWRALVGRGTEGAVGGAGGASAGSTAVGGGALGGSLAGLGAPAALKVVAVVAAVGGGAVGMASGTVPAAVGDVAGSIVGQGSEQAPSVLARSSPGGGEVPGTRVAADGVTAPAGAETVAHPGGTGHAPAGGRGPHAVPSGADAHGRPGSSSGQAGKAGSTPPGLVKHGGGPPGQSKPDDSQEHGGRPDVPPGQAKKGADAPGNSGSHGRSGTAPGQAKKGAGAPGNSGSHGRSGAAPGQANKGADAPGNSGSHGRSGAAPGQANKGGGQPGVPPGQANEGGRPDTPPGQAKQAPATAPGQAKQGANGSAPNSGGQGGAPASAPGQAKQPATSGQPPNGGGSGGGQSNGGQGGRGGGGPPQK